MCKPKITFRNGRWVVHSGIHYGIPTVIAEGMTVIGAWNNYIRYRNAFIRNGYIVDCVDMNYCNPGGINYIELKQDRVSIFERVRRFFHG